MRKNVEDEENRMKIRMEDVEKKVEEKRREY
jgi:hypothetical protein